MGGGAERTRVEQPFVDQLVSLGWDYTTGSVDHPSASGRSTFRGVFLEHDLKQSLRRINLDPSREAWLDESRLSQAISALQRLGSAKLLEANDKATGLLIKGTVVDGVEGWDQGRQRTVHFIDWDHPENNTFRVINQFRVDEPGGQSHSYITPDLVLFINGIPVGVVECKSPLLSSPMPEAIEQLRRYANRRRADGEVDADEGNERLFHTNQLLVATCFDEARVGTISAGPAHFLEWKDTFPVPMEKVAAQLGKPLSALSSQEKLVAGMLRPAHLLDLIRHFTLFQEVGGRRIKILARYQQFRAVNKAVDRLLTGKTRKEDGEHDRRGGIIWHTQGSGKSLSMVFLVRKMRSEPDLRRFKVLVVTDRKDLQSQLSDTAALSGETVRIAGSTGKLKDLLQKKAPDLVFATIQKYADRDDNIIEAPSESFPVLNEDDAILVMVDEAHRSHSSALHANLLNALPNCARIGFTGTPIIMGAKKRTHEIFGDFLDRYTIAQSEEDGATVPILYEGRTAEGAIADGRDLDQLFEDLFRDYTEEELEAIKQKYATKGSVLEAQEMIQAKARDMIRHYAENILPNGLKAQVVAASRRAAVRYHEALMQAREDLVAEVEALDPALRDLDDEALAGRPRDEQAVVRAGRNLELLKEIEFATIISGAQNDPGDWSGWTDAAQQTARIARFKKPLLGDPKKTDPLAFLIVKSMLLTGFDAPVEGVMYLDRAIREAELLQAIARVNRTAERKEAGIIVDYYGVARHLKEALEAYSDEDVKGALKSLKDELPKLRDRHERVVGLFTTRGAEIADDETCVQLLADEQLRAEFSVKLKQFLVTLDVVLPRPEALPYVPDSKRLALIYARTRHRYKTGLPPIGKSTGHKVQKLIDDHVRSLGIDPTIEPINLTDVSFSKHVEKQVSLKAKASEMEHALKHHIHKHFDEDPVRYKELSERLEEILKKYQDDWEQLALDLTKVREEVLADSATGEEALPVAKHEAPFYKLLKQELVGKQAVSPELDQKLTSATHRLVELLAKETGTPNFWGNKVRQEEVRGRVFRLLRPLMSLDRSNFLADQIMEVAKANREKLRAQ